MAARTKGARVIAWRQRRMPEDSGSSRACEMRLIYMARLEKDKVCQKERSMRPIIRKCGENWGKQDSRKGALIEGARTCPITVFA